MTPVFFKGDLMNIHAISSQLLETLANSIYDRDPANPNPFFFSVKEIHIVEKWLTEVLKEAENDLNK
jgi:hypothetical protein